MWIAGTSAALWPIWLAFTPAGPGGLLLVMGVEFGVIVSMSLFNPVVATFRLKHTAHERLARTLSAWSITTSLTTAGMTILWGILATVTTPRIAIGIAGVLLLFTPLLLPRREHMQGKEFQRSQRPNPPARQRDLVRS
jgi:hypothetical protein